MGTVTTVEGGVGDLGGRSGHARGKGSTFGRRGEARESSENLYGLALGQIGVKESVQVTVEHYGDVGLERGRTGSSGETSGSQSLKSMFPRGYR